MDSDQVLCIPQLVFPTSLSFHRGSFLLGQGPICSIVMQNIAILKWNVKKRKEKKRWHFFTERCRKKLDGSSVGSLYIFLYYCLYGYSWPGLDLKLN